MPAPVYTSPARAALTRSIADSVKSHLMQCAFSETLAGNIGKPAGKRFCDLLAFNVKAKGYEGARVFIAGTKAFSRITIHFAHNDEFSESLPYESNVITEEMASKAKAMSETRAQQLSELRAQMATVDAQADKYRSALLALDTARKAVDACNTPYSVRVVIEAETKISPR